MPDRLGAKGSALLGPTSFVKLRGRGAWGRIRERQRETGERCTTARREVLSRPAWVIEQCYNAGMKLYGFWRSTCTWRVRIALAMKGIEHQYQPVHLQKGEQHGDEFARKNPMRQVPLLELDDGTCLAQSMAILDHLDEQYPDPPLLPKAPLLRARARQLAEIIASGIRTAAEHQHAALRS